ncbi:histone RNA hairpin-binding protein RNA-binding domain-containing protein [Globomyces pollinis-pini]|nr:histone RNA hairpin-binding protein RNA-binding domain-containing protein [Globomyces pollinis-pini]
MGLMVREDRKVGDPVTPDKYSKCSKRAWDGLVRSWRRKLHAFDPPDQKTPTKSV